MLYISGLYLVLYKVSFINELLELLGLSLAHLLLVGLGVNTFFHGHDAGSEQKKADRPNLKCIEHPAQSPDGKSGCFVPLCFGPLFEPLGACEDA